MTTLSVAKSQADRADPKKILGDFLRQTEFMGEPIFTLLIDDLSIERVDHRPYVKNFVNYKIEDHPAYTKKQKRGLQEFFDRFGGKRYAAISAMRNGTECSARAYRNEANDTLPLGVVVADPSRMYSNYILSGVDVCRSDGRYFLSEQTYWQGLIHAHERAHTIGANEPQADKMAAILCRKNFNCSSAVALMSDLRMVDCTKAAIAYFYAYKDVRGGSLDKLHFYGYPMVVANDDVLSMPQVAIKSMTDYRICKIVHEQFDHKVDVMKEFGWMAITTQADGKILSRNINEIADGAVRLKQKTDQSTDNEDLLKIADRFALATKRLAEGAPAYAAVQEQVQKYGSLTPT